MKPIILLEETKMLSKEKKNLLKQIVTDKFAVGAFSGMIFNARIHNPEYTTEQLVNEALEVRLKLSELMEDGS